LPLHLFWKKVQRLYGLRAVERLGLPYPYFTREVGKQVVEDQNELNDFTEESYSCEGLYDSEEKVFKFYEPYNDDWLEFGPVEIASKILYTIDAQY